MSDTLRQVYQIFDPAPLLAKDHDLYVNLDDVRGSAGVVLRLAKTIRLSDQPTCQILAGHRGSGKSTELRRLQRELENGEPRCFVVFCDADDHISRNDVDFPDVLVAIVRELASQLDERTGIKLGPGYFRDRWQRLTQVFGSEVAFDKLELKAGMVKLAGAIKSSPDARISIRKLFEPDLDNWLHATNQVLNDAKKQLKAKGYDDLVIIVDDLDKMVNRAHEAAGCSTAEYLFIHREGQLSGFDCHLVYTMPIALAYSALEQTIAHLYGGYPPVIPMTRIRKRPPSTDLEPAGMERFRETIARRLDKIGVDPAAVFASEAVCDEFIKLSGGQPRELMILLRAALVTGDLPLDEAAVERAAREGRRAHARHLLAEHWPLIEGAAKTGSIERTKDNDALVRELLDSRTLLVYRNDQEWYAPNPLVSDKPPS